MKKVILMIRVSTVTQSYAAQEQELFNYALNEGYKEDEILSIAHKESALKLSDAERQGLTEMYNAIGVLPNPQWVEGQGNKGIARYLYVDTPHKIEAVYLWELSRLSRREVTLAILKRYFEDNGIQLFVMTQSIKLLQPDGKASMAGSLMFSIHQILCTTEMQNKLDRFRRTKVSNGLNMVCGNHSVLYGYKNENRHYVINEEEAEVIRDIFRMNENGMTLSQIVTNLRDRGITRRGGKVFYCQDVWHILSNESYTGKSIGRRSKIERFFPVIVSKEQFQRCAEIRFGSIVRARAKDNFKAFYAYGTVVCAVCNRILYPTPNQWGGYSYFCEYRKSGKGLNISRNCTFKGAINVDVIDSLAWHYASIWESRSRSEKSKADKAKIHDDIDSYRKKICEAQNKIKKYEARIERLKEMRIDGEIEKETYNEKKAEVTAKNNELSSRIVEYTNIIQLLEESINVEGVEAKEGKTLAEVRSITDECVRQELVRKHIQSIKFYEYERYKSRKIEMDFINGHKVTLLYYIPHNQKDVKVERIYNDKPNASPLKFEMIRRGSPTRKKGGDVPSAPLSEI